MELVWVGRAMVLLVALIAIALAANPENRVLGLVSYAWAGFGAAFGPVVLISVIWKDMTRNGALAGILVGAITVIVWKHFELLGLYEIIPWFHLRQPGDLLRQQNGRTDRRHASALCRGREGFPPEQVMGMS